MNGESIEKRAAKVSLANGLSTVLALAFQLVSVPICLKYWGRESYGSWLALFSAFMLLRSLDSGFTVYVGNKLNYLYHGNTRALRTHLSSAWVGVVIIGVLELVLALGTLIFAPLATALGVPAGYRDSVLAQIGLTAMVLSWTLTGSYIGIVHRLLIPAGMMYQAAWWAMAFQITQFAGIMASALLHFNLLQTSLVFAAAQFAIYLGSAWYVRRSLPEFSPWLQGADVRLGIRDLRDSLTLTWSNIIQQGATSGVVVLVSALGGPAAVPVFTTVRTITNLWTSVTTILTAPLLPDVVRIHVTGEMGKLVSINQAFWVLVGSLINIGSLLLYPLMPLLYGRWTAHAVRLDRPLLCLMLASVVATNSGALVALYLNGINSLRIVLRTAVVRAIFGLGAGAAGYRYFGLSSFGLGILAGELVATLITMRYFVTHKLSDKGFQLSAWGLGPIMLGSGSALLFFLGSGFGWWSGEWIWLAALASVASASIWGWRILELPLRSRLSALARSYLLPFLTASR
jgi:O-antigen/teichoic acid export membrane protein